MLQGLKLILGIVGAAITIIIVLCILYLVYKVCYDVVNNIITKRNDKKRRSV